MKNKLKILILLLFSLITQLTLAGEKIDVSMAVDEDEIIDIEIINGDINITGWDENRVQITGELSDNADGYEFENRNGVIHFEEEIENPRSFWRNGNVDRAELEISVPINTTIRFEGVNVELQAKNITGNTQVEIINGSVIAEELSGRVNLETVNGSIETSNLNGRIDISSVNGSILDSNSEGNRVFFSNTNGNIESNIKSTIIDVDNVNGSVDLYLAEFEDLEVSSVNGSIEVSLSLSDDGNIEIATVGGRIELIVDPDISARFDIKTTAGGRIRNNLSEHEAVRENRFVNSSELRFSLNGGDGNIDISTVRGNITLSTK